MGRWMRFAPPKYDLTRIGRLVFGHVVARESWGCVGDERYDREARESRGNDGSFSGQHQPYTCRAFRGQDHLWGPPSDKASPKDVANGRSPRGTTRLDGSDGRTRPTIPGWSRSNYCMDPVHHISRGQRNYPSPISITLIIFK